MRGSKASRERRSGWLLRIMATIAILGAGAWYLLPQQLDHQQEFNEPQVIMTTLDDVNLRTGPGTSYDVISVVPAGTNVVASTVPESGFLQVSVAGERGWMSADYLSAPGSVRARSQSVSAAEVAPAGSDAIDEDESTASWTAPEPTAQPTYAPVLAQSTQVQAEPQPGEKWIEVNRTTRTVTLHNGEIIVAQFDALIGKDLSADGYYSTATGTYRVHVMEKALVETPFAEGVYLTDFVGFDPDRSNGFHSPVRDEDGNVVNTGGTSTLGCVRLSEADAVFLFEFAHVGMRVEVHD